VLKVYKFQICLFTPPLGDFHNLFRHAFLRRLLPPAGLFRHVAYSLLIFPHFFLLFLGNY
jgi:hypothetical protein